VVHGDVGAHFVGPVQIVDDIGKDDPGALGDSAPAEHDTRLRSFYAVGRSAHYAIGVNDKEWSETVNRELLLIAMIEDIAALNPLDAVLAVPHLDAIHIGPTDL